MALTPESEDGALEESDHSEIDEGDDPQTVLEVFGLKLEVSNPRLADLLTMDAREAGRTDMKELIGAESVSSARAQAVQGAPDLVLSPQTPKDEHEARERDQLRARVKALGEKLGFVTSGGGMWESQTGLTLLTRSVAQSVSFAGATHFVTELSEHRKSACTGECAALFIVPDQQTADVFKVAIRQRKVYDEMRTVAIDNLAELASMHASSKLSHAQALMLLAPVANIDVGEVLSVIRASQTDDAV